MVFSKKACTIIATINKGRLIQMLNLRKSCLIPLAASLAIFCVACANDVGDQTKDVQVTPLVETDSIAFITPAPDAHRDELNAILKRSTMLEGVTVNGVSVGGMTVSQARDAVRAQLDQQTGSYAVHVTFGDQTADFTDATIALTDDLDAVLDEAFNLVREDKGFDAVSREVESIRTAGRDFTVTRHFAEAPLYDAVKAFVESRSVAPVNASVAYNKSENKIDFVPEVNGKAIDGEALLAALLEANDGDTVEALVTEIPAEITQEELQAKLVIRGTKTTDYSSSNKNRKENIRHGAMDLLTGTVVHPGEVFSMNDCLGVRKNDGHWKLATAYQQGKHVPEYGGGVCQISTTLYNAAVTADMEIVFRQNHSMPVGYIQKGLDATINSIGNLIDFKFKNTSKSDIIIIANATGKKLTIDIWGIPVIEDSDGKYDNIIIPDPEYVKPIYPSGDIYYEVDNTKPVGYKEKTVDRQNGSVWQSYVEYYLNGKLIPDGRKKLATSTYKAYSGAYIIGPEATPAPDTPTPSDTPKPTPTEGSSDPTAPADTPKSSENPTAEPTAEPTKAPDPTKEPTAEPTKEPAPSDAGGDGNSEGNE